jgi:hypothetical protein
MAKGKGKSTPPASEPKKAAPPKRGGGNKKEGLRTLLDRMHKMHFVNFNRAFNRLVKGQKRNYSGAKD